MDSFINPREYLEQQKQKLEELQKKKKMFPPEPEKDVLLFLLENSPLEPWQRDILSIVREESYYFAPQAMTKIMNEGWAVYWHSMIMTKRCLKDSEIIDYADHHSGTLAVYPGRINPYKIGVELFKDIEDRWDKGRFGKEYNDCDEFVKKQDWDMKLGIGREKIFEVRKYHNDITFIEEFLTPEFCRKNKLFTFKLNPRSGFYEIKDRDFENIKSQLLFALTNFGQPYIYVKDGNYKNRGELYIIHKHLGVDLQIEYSDLGASC
jgi:stage V sporulation protein R